MPLRMGVVLQIHHVLLHKASMPEIEHLVTLTNPPQRFTRFQQSNNLKTLPVFVKRNRTGRTTHLTRPLYVVNQRFTLTTVALLSRPRLPHHRPTRPRHLPMQPVTSTGIRQHQRTLKMRRSSRRSLLHSAYHLLTQGGHLLQQTDIVLSPVIHRETPVRRLEAKLKPFDLCFHPS